MTDDYRQIILDCIPGSQHPTDPSEIDVDLIEDTGECFLAEFSFGTDIFCFAYNRRLPGWNVAIEEEPADRIRSCKKWIEWSLSARLLSLKDIYSAPVVGSPKGIYLLTGGFFNNLPELPDDFDPEQDRVTIKVHYDPYIDGERCCTVGSVWFDDSPVMVFRHAGRGGHDVYDRFISDKARFGQMVDFLRSLLTVEESEEIEVIDPNEPLLELTEFYGYWLDFQEENRGD